jgi:hypothetical protein
LGAGPARPGAAGAAGTGGGAGGAGGAGARIVDLGPRGVTHTHGQVVRVSAGGHQLGTIAFSVTLTLDVELMAAAVEEERLRRVGLHGCRLTATLSAAGEPVRSASCPVAFPRSFGVGSGLPTVPSGRARR